MKMINSMTEKLADDLRATMRPDGRASIAAAIYACEELRRELGQLDELRFIFTSPAFLKEKPERSQRDFGLSMVLRGWPTLPSAGSPALILAVSGAAGRGADAGTEKLHRQRQRSKAKMRKEKALAKQMELGRAFRGENAWITAFIIVVKSFLLQFRLAEKTQQIQHQSFLSRIERIEDRRLLWRK